MLKYKHKAFGGIQFQKQQLWIKGLRCEEGLSLEQHMIFFPTAHLKAPRWDQQVCKLSRNDKTVGKDILKPAEYDAVQLSHAFLLIRGERPHAGCLAYV